MFYYCVLVFNSILLLVLLLLSTLQPHTVLSSLPTENSVPNSVNEDVLHNHRALHGAKEDALHPYRKGYAFLKLGREDALHHREWEDTLKLGGKEDALHLSGKEDALHLPGREGVLNYPGTRMPYNTPPRGQVRPLLPWTEKDVFHLRGALLRKTKRWEGVQKNLVSVRQ